MNQRKVVVFGAGKIGKLLLKYCRLNKTPVLCVLDNDEKKWGKKICGIGICNPQNAKEQYKDEHFLIASVNHSYEIEKQLLSYGVDRTNILVYSDYDELEYKLMKKKNVKIINQTKFLILNRPLYKTPKYRFKKMHSYLLMGYYKLLMKLVKPPKISKQVNKYDVSICAIFRDEADYLREWIEFHLLAGVQHFYLYNNFSKDNYLNVLEKYICQDIVTLIDWPIEKGQMSAYQDCVKKYSSDTKWIGFFDIDEFCVPNKNNEIYDFLMKFNNKAPIVIINWKYFGSSGLINRDIKGLVVEDFVVSWPKYADLGKFFYNTAYEYKPSPKHGEHMHYMWGGYKGIDLPPVNVFGQICIDRFFPLKNDDLPIQLNHYVIKSYNEYFEKKSKRGGGVHGIEMHDTSYFYSHDEMCQSVDYHAYKYVVKLKERCGLM